MLVSAFALLLALAAMPGSPARAADDSDIPGVPLPGSIVTGRLGGPIYDRVYQLDIEPNRIILLSLTGDPGTDFDLYLFDSSAPSVYAGIGQAAASAGPTSSESISYPSRGGGRYYINLHGFSEAEGDFRLAVAIRTDTTPPYADLLLNGRDLATREATVVVTLVATDDLSGVDEMQMSPDGTTWFDWRPYTPTILWTFDRADGPKRLWARVRDRSGNLSAPAVAGIDLDTRSPTIESRDPEPSGALGDPPTIRVRFSEPIDPDSWVRDGLLVQALDGSRVPGELGWDPATNTGSYRISGDPTPGTSYTVSIGGVTDRAGNPLAQPGSWIVRVLHRHDVRLAASATVVQYAAPLILRGTIDLPLRSGLVLERAVAGGAWNAIGPLSVDTSGAFSLSTTGTGNGSYRVRVLGNGTEAELTSDPVRVLVRRSVSLLGLSATSIRTGPVGRTTTVIAAVTPSEPNVAVTLTVARYDTARRTWRTLSTTTRTSVGGRASFTWRPTSPGSYYLRVATAPGSLFANGVSPTYRWTIR